jgi:hypothetical protein
MLTLRHLTSCVIGSLLCACGPLNHPMFDRVSPEAQAQVNTAWNNMLSSPHRLDRQTLLEVIAERQLFQTGITRGSFHAEKTLATGIVVMDITFDESNPLNDRFEIRVYDLAWNLLRSETYHRDEVDAAEDELAKMNQYLNTAATQPATQKWVEVPETAPSPSMTAEQLADWTALHQAAISLRNALDAATQPAASPNTRP